MRTAVKNRVHALLARHGIRSEHTDLFGKAGRAETATDPAPLEMFETTIQFKPRSEWRAGMTPESSILFVR